MTAPRGEGREGRDAEIASLRAALAVSEFKVAALSKIDERGVGHDDALSLIAHHVHEIQVLCDAFGYDPFQWLQDEPDGAWQPIETAPRAKGARLLVYDDDVHMATRGQTAEMKRDGWFDERGWLIHPSHWMPLPPAPLTEK